MNDITNKPTFLDEDLNEIPVSSATKFLCPTCGEISQDDVIFLCNKCRSDEVIFQDGVYLCPSCLDPGENFECFVCGSKEVQMVKPS